MIKQDFRATAVPAVERINFLLSFYSISLFQTATSSNNSTAFWKLSVLIGDEIDAEVTFLNSFCADSAQEARVAILKKLLPQDAGCWQIDQTRLSI